jgi:hypothetical protein
VDAWSNKIRLLPLIDSCRHGKTSFRVTLQPCHIALAPVKILSVCVNSVSKLSPAGTAGLIKFFNLNNLVSMGIFVDRRSLGVKPTNEGHGFTLP